MAFTFYEAWALMLVFTTRSELAQKLDALVKDNSKTLDDVYHALVAALTTAPFNLNPQKIHRSRWEKLWTSSSGVKAAQIDRAPMSVASVFLDVIGVYDPPPCPDATAQSALWNKLTS